MKVHLQCKNQVVEVLWTVYTWAWLELSKTCKDFQHSQQNKFELWNKFTVLSKHDYLIPHLSYIVTLQGFSVKLLSCCSDATWTCLHCSLMMKIQIIVPTHSLSPSDGDTVIITKRQADAVTGMFYILLTLTKHRAVIWRRSCIMLIYKKEERLQRAVKLQNKPPWWCCHGEGLQYVAVTIAEVWRPWGVGELHLEYRQQQSIREQFHKLLSISKRKKSIYCVSVSLLHNIGFLSWQQWSHVRQTCKRGENTHFNI